MLTRKLFLRFCQSRVSEVVALYDLLFPRTNITMFALYRNVDQVLNAKGEYEIFTTLLCRSDKSGPIEQHFFVSIHERVLLFFLTMTNQPTKVT